MSNNSQKWFLVGSNAFYILPAGTVLYKMLWTNGRKLDRYDGTGLLVLYLFVALIASPSYHCCRSDLSSNNDSDTVSIGNCSTCPRDNTMAWTSLLPGSEMELNFQVSKIVDYLSAMMLTLETLLLVMPLQAKLRQCILVISIIWMVLFLSTGNEMIALLPNLLAMILLLFFWWTVRKVPEKGPFTRNRVWGAAFVCLILAGIFFKIVREPYYVFHSLWHILGAIAAALLLSKLCACYEGIDDKDIDFPKWMDTLFTRPNECNVYDR